MELKYTEFNEPQKGKEQCDRDAAVIKHHIKSYWHSGHDISNSLENFDAVLHGRGVRNVKPSIIEINTTYSDLDKVILPDIQSYHSFEFHSEEVAFRKYHKIGEGAAQQILLEDIHCTPSYKVVKEFQKPFPAGWPARTSTKPSVSSKNTNHLTIFCPDDSCDDIFSAMAELDAHLLKGKHNYSSSVSFDAVKVNFAKRMKNVECIKIF